MSAPIPPSPDAPRSLLGKIALVQKHEVAAVVWSCIYFFAVLASYFILRPVREQMGIVGDIEKLKWSFTATLAAMLLTQPLFSALVSRYPRRTFIPAANRFFIANLALFFVLFEVLPSEHQAGVAQAFYIWVSVFNLFVVSVFWGLMADLFSEEQGRRLFGLIAVGGTLGALAGAGIASLFAKQLGPIRLIPISIVLLEVAVQCVYRLTKIFGDLQPRSTRAPAGASAGNAPVGGTLWSGMRLTFGSSYLIGIALYALLQGLSMTFLYFEQAKIVKASIADKGAQTALFAQIDFAVQALTLVVEVFLTGRLLAYFGLGVALVALPVISVIGFSVLGAWPVLGVVIVFQVLMRGGNYAVATPARQVLYTVVSREEKYKSKTFIDTVVYRVGDALGAWTKDSLNNNQLGVAGVTLLSIPLGIVWAVNSWMLGRQQKRIASGAAVAVKVATLPSKTA